MTDGRRTSSESSEADAALQRRDLLLTSRKGKTRSVAAGPLSRSDEQLMARVGSPEPKKSGRKYRCGTCGLMAFSEDMTPDFDEEGRRVGMICDSCY